MKCSEKQTAFWFSLAAFIFFSFFTFHHVFLAGNDASRFAHIESIVDYGISNIDRSRYAWTVDRATINGVNYSNKPPLLGMIGAGFYLLIRAVTGWTFATHESPVVWLLTVILAALPSAWLVFQFYLALGRYPSLPAPYRHLTTIALVMGTILISFSVTLNNHTVEAALLFAAIYAAWQGKSFMAGLWAGLAVCIDIVPGLGFLPVVL